MIVNSYNDWDQLEEIIIGSPLYSNVPYHDISMEHFFQTGKGDFSEFYKGAVPEKVIEEAEEDFQQLIEVLNKFGVVVKRPDPFDQTKEYSTPYWSSRGMHALMPRDCMLVVGDLIIETPMACRARYYESFSFRQIILDYFKKGAKIISAPKPMLLDDTYINSEDNTPIIANNEPLFDAANVIRCGEDIFFNISNTGNKMGLDWLQIVLGENFRVHPISLCWDHIGTTFVPLAPGKVLINAERVSKEQIPDHFKSWDHIWCTDMAIGGYGLDWPRASKWIGLNLLSINPETIIVEESQIQLIKQLESHGFTVIPVRFRHGRTFGGGFHCDSLDIRRKGKLERYF